MPDITFGEAARRYGVTARQLEHWTGRGYLNVTRNGYGNARHIDEAEQAVLAQLVRLIRIGFRWDAAAPLARQLAAGDTLHFTNGVQITITLEGATP